MEATKIGAPVTKKRMESLQVLRCLAFIIVFMSHCTFIDGFRMTWPYVGASTFVILSGFVVTMKPGSLADERRPKVIPYVLKRLKKLYPLLIVTLMLQLWINTLQGTTHVRISHLLLNLTMLKSFVPDRDVYYSISGPIWYLSLVWFFALMTPALLRALKKIDEKGIWKPVFCLIVVFRVIWFYVWHGHDLYQWITYINPVFRLTDYFMGMMLGLKMNDIKAFFAKRNQLRILLGVVTLAVFVGHYILFCFVRQPWYTVYLKAPISIAMIIIFLCAEQSGERAKKIFFENKVLVFIGDLSFELYLLHGPMIKLSNVVMNVIGMSNWVLQLAMVCVMTVAASWIFMQAERFVTKQFKNA